jgi:hypothetical protein
MLKNLNTRWNLFHENDGKSRHFGTAVTHVTHKTAEHTERWKYRTKVGRWVWATSTELRHAVLEGPDGSTSGKGCDIKWGGGVEQDAVEETEEKRRNSLST